MSGKFHGWRSLVSYSSRGGKRVGHKENVVYSYNIILFSLKKDGNTTICDNMDRLEGIMRSEMSKAKI